LNPNRYQFLQKDFEYYWHLLLYKFDGMYAAI
jgi:hypothetical protein